jgi:hypothetical protein
MRKRTFLILPILLITTSCSSSGDNEASRSAFFSACTLITSSYDTWGATGQSTSTETGQLGRQNLESNFNEAQSSLSGFVSEGELEDAKNATTDVSLQEVTGAQIYVQIKEMQSLINNWESVVQYPNWTPGKMATFDSNMNALKASCDAYQNKNN